MNCLFPLFCREPPDVIGLTALHGKRKQKHQEGRRHGGLQKAWTATRPSRRRSTHHRSHPEPEEHLSPLHRGLDSVVHEAQGRSFDLGAPPDALIPYMSPRPTSFPVNQLGSEKNKNFP